MSMVHYLSGFVARDLSGLAVERLFRFISSIQGGDNDGSGKVSAKRGICAVTLLGVLMSAVSTGSGGISPVFQQSDSHVA